MRSEGARVATGRGGSPGRSLCTSSLAESHLGLGHHPSALSCLKRSLRLRRKVGDKVGEVGVLYDLAKVYEDLGDKDLARKTREEAASKEGTSGEAREAVSTVERKN